MSDGPFDQNPLENPRNDGAPGDAPDDGRRPEILEPSEQFELFAQGRLQPIEKAAFSPPHEPPRPRIAINILLFLATIFTTLLAGAVMAEVNPIENPGLIYKGIPFSFALMSILLSHELGHYFMSRKHGVEATLPYFIPAPTMIGTFGAVIKMRSSVPTRRALLDIGAAGPIVGFIVSIPFLLVGLSMSKVTPGAPEGITFGTSLLLEFMARYLFPNVPDGHAIYLHPVALAGWLGLLVTMMNLLPMGSMDGGHIAYALFGKRHRSISRVVVAIMFVMGAFGWPGWIVWGALNLVFGLKHPPPMNPHEPLDRKRKLVAVAAGLIFILTFVPTPISI
jgi:membrane-associated protease RseP (regulator of RpoE activity)